MTTGTWAFTYFGAQCFAPTLKTLCALNITSGHTHYIGVATLFLIMEGFLLTLIPQESLRANPKRQREKDLAALGVVPCPHQMAYAQG